MLPSSRRPKDLEVTLAVPKAAEKPVPEKLVFRASLKDIFRNDMAEWYKGLNEKQKLRLTPLALKRKAVAVCYKYDMVYDRLPLNWVRELQEKHGLKLYERKKRKSKDDYDKVKMTKDHEGSKSNTRRISAERGEAARRRTGGRSLSPKPATSSNIANNAETPESEIRAKVPTRPSTKRFLDLSNEPPPPYWLQKYSEGIVLPRVLTVYSTEDTNILFYDYCPKLQDELGQEYKLQPQPRHNLDVFENAV